MLDRPTLEKLPTETLNKLAQKLNLSEFAGGPRNHLIEAILESAPEDFDIKPFLPKPEIKKPQAQPVTEESSSFINNDSSSFVQVLPEEDQSSAFVRSEVSPPMEEDYDFVQPEETVHSTFLKPESVGPSEFIKPGDDTSSFVSGGEGSPSQFILPDKLGEGVEKTATVHNLTPGSRIVLNNQPYNILRIISESSREAVIYEVRDAQNNPFVLKLYKAHKHAGEEPNTEALTRIQGINNPDILKLYDFGTGDKKYQQQYCFEISALARGGNLLDVQNFKQKYSVDFLEKIAIPEIFKGIQALHSRRIYHCDLKPQNIFFLNEEKTDLVIGDYGSSKTFEEESNRSAQQFDSVIATNAYMAPEQANRIISPKVDYYAFGMVLVHLFYPEYFTRNDNPRVVDKEKSGRIRENQYNQEEILPFNPQYRRINQLIGGLTLYNHQSRWGEKEVEKWIRGEQVDVNYKGQSLIKPINIGYPTIPAIRTPKELIQAIETYPNQWYDDLITRTSGFNALIDWFASRYDLQVARVFEQMIEFYKKQGKVYVKEAICRYFEPERPLLSGNQTYTLYDNPNAWQEVVRYMSDLDNRWKKSTVADLRFSIFSLEFCMRQYETSASEQAVEIRRYLDSVEGSLGSEKKKTFTDYHTVFQDFIPLAEKETESALRKVVLLIYLINLKRPFKDRENRPIETLEELGYFFARNPDMYKDLPIIIERDFFLHMKQRKELVGIAYADFLFGVFPEQTQTQINLANLRVNQNREYHSQYTYQKSLSQFFKKQNINRALDEGGNKQALTLVQSTRLLQFPPGVFSGFLKTVQEKHKIPDKVIIPQNREAIKRKFVGTAAWQLLGHHFKELLAAFCLLIPVWGILGLFMLKDAYGIPLIGQYFRETRLAEYLENSEVYPDYTGSFYLIWLVFAAIYLLALIPRIWAGKNLELIGKTTASTPATPKVFAINGGSGFVFLAFMMVFPVFLMIVNWMYELIGLSAWFTLTFVLYTRTSGKGRSKGKTIAALLLMAGLARLAMEIWSWEKYSEPMGMPIPYRGLIDLGFYLFSLVIFFIPPVWYQMFKAHSRIHLGLKTGLLFLAGILFIGVSGMSNRPFSFTDFFSGSTPAAEVELPIANVWFGKITGVTAMNLRSGPGTNYGVVRVVKSEEIFRVEKGVTGAWWMITLCDGNSGYLYSTKIQLLENITLSQSQEFLNGGGPCATGNTSENINPVSSTPPLPQTNFSGNVGKLEARFLLNTDAENRLNGAYFYPSRNDGQVYNLLGTVLPNNQLEVFEYTGNVQSATCMLTYSETAGCYIGSMNNNDGRILDLRICGQKFNHPADIQPVFTPADAFAARIKGNNVNIRDNPSAQNSTVITRLDNGDRILVIGSETESGGSTLITNKKTPFELTNGSQETLEKGQLLFIQSHEVYSGKFFVAANLSGNTLTQGYVSILDVSLTDGKIWYKIRFGANQEGWVFEDFIRK
ncbi:MAG: protein kinase [Bacteroidia bacterium]|nr:protein kinase [Bacteroidia bacterium]